MKTILTILFLLIIILLDAQDTIKVNLINTNTEQSLTTANPPIFRIFTINSTDKPWVILENIRHQERLEWLWTIEIQDKNGNVYTKKADWSIINDTINNFKTKVVIAKSKAALNMPIYITPYLENFMYESWQYYTFLPGKYRLRLTYQLPINEIDKIEEILPNRNYKSDNLTIKTIQTNWLSFKIEKSNIFFPIDFQNITTSKVENPYLNWMKQLTILQNGKHIKEQLFDTHNHLIAEFVPTEPTDTATLINLYSGKQFEIRNNHTINGQFRHYSSGYHGVKENAFRELMRTKGNIKGGKLNNIIYSYEPFGSYSKRITHYKNGLPNGRFEQWQRPKDSTDFVLREKGFYRDSLLHKAFIEYYHDNGKIFRKLRYNNGLVDGKIKVYHKNGQLMLVEKFLPKIKNEKIHLNDNRLLAGKLYHDTQIKNGTFANYDTLGNLTQKRHYKNDKPVGKHFQKIILDDKTYTTNGFYKNEQPWKGQFIYNQTQTTRGRYGVERKYTIYRMTYEKGEVIKEEILKNGNGWLF
ncbi:MAG: hypothetical protein AB8G11_18835 [Saprospiraceae bacterium]